jgi:hypothetical protein
MYSPSSLYYPLLRLATQLSCARGVREPPVFDLVAPLLMHLLTGDGTDITIHLSADVATALTRAIVVKALVARM